MGFVWTVPSQNLHRTQIPCPLISGIINVVSVLYVSFLNIHGYTRNNIRSCIGWFPCEIFGIITSDGRLKYSLSQISTYHHTIYNWNNPSLANGQSCAVLLHRRYTSWRLCYISISVEIHSKWWEGSHIMTTSDEHRSTLTALDARIHGGGFPSSP